MIVDDEPANVALLERLLRSLGVAEIHPVTDSREAVRRCLDADANLLLLDLHMPSPDGFEVMADLQEALPTHKLVPVLVLTADATTATRDRALQVGAKDFLTKPFDRTEVLLRAQNLLRTSLLHARVQAHNDALQHELAQRRAQERRDAEARSQRRRRINRVLDEGALATVFQPIADLRSGCVLGAEALTRFHHEPQRPPDEWFGEAADAGLGAELELAAVRAALSHLGELPPAAFLSVNVAPETTLEPSLGALLDTVHSDRLVLELTEHARIDDYERLASALAELRERGVRVAVDDAGAGYAGLQHVLSLRPDILKLDLALTRGIDTDPARRALATGMVAFANELSASLIAEGIETQSELETLQALNVPSGQGYYLSHPAELPLPDPLTTLGAAQG